MPASSTSPPPAEPGPVERDLVARLRLAIARLARQQRRSYPAGLTPSQQSALAIIDRHGPIRLTDLARQEVVAPPTITRIVSKLQGDGLVERHADPGDRRIARVSITEAGHQRMVETREARNRWLAGKLVDLPASDLEAILAAVEPLERLVASAGHGDLSPAGGANPPPASGADALRSDS